ncbi:MAG: arginine--tRNA ligase [Acidimicrobiia bacterium]|nr:arginine--tRNA ligase [Acidimicrobiia bacterium]NNC75103.1 arginine--tRNA ligase [Acidimicrobiia bacterium]
MSLLQRLTALVGDAFVAEGADASAGQVVPSQRPELAQFQCNGAMGASKALGRNPRDLAEAVIARLDPSTFVETSVAGPGFINLAISGEALAAAIEAMHGDERVGHQMAGDPRAIVVDYGGPNVAKSMHVGHLRATIIGDSLKRIARFVGHRVWGDAHFGDWGTQMGQTIVGIAERYPDLPFFAADYDSEQNVDIPITLDDLQEIYPDVSRRAKEDEELAAAARKATLELQQGRPGYRDLWRHLYDVSLEAQRADFTDLGVEFDLWFGESTVHDRCAPIISNGQQAGVAVEDQGALVVHVDLPGDNREWPPLILAKSDGAYTYGTTDVATVDYRADELDAGEAWYVVDARQADHFEQVFRAARKLGVAPASMVLDHVKFGTMNGPDGRPFKTREGGILKLRDLIDMVTEAAMKRIEAQDLGADMEKDERFAIARQVGLAALKYGDLQNHRASDYMFDLDRFVSFDGKTGPYLQYAAVRIKSILRRVAEEGIEPGRAAAPINDGDEALMLQLVRLPEVIDRSLDSRAPNHIAEYTFELAAVFNRFYEQCHILSESDPIVQASWVTLVETTLAALTLLLDLLGIEVPARM